MIAVPSPAPPFREDYTPTKYNAFIMWGDWLQPYGMQLPVVRADRAGFINQCLSLVAIHITEQTAMLNSFLE